MKKNDQFVVDKFPQLAKGGFLGLMFLDF